MKILFICIVSAVLLVNAQAQECYEVTMENDVREEMGYIWATLACNVLLLGINITITIVIFKFISPAYKEIRKITFFLMDRILLSYMASVLRPALGCRKEVELKALEPSGADPSMKEGATSKMETSKMDSKKQKTSKKEAGGKAPAGGKANAKPAGKKAPAKKSGGKKKDESASEE